MVEEEIEEVNWPSGKGTCTFARTLQTIKLKSAMIRCKLNPLKSKVEYVLKVSNQLRYPFPHLAKR